jgi:hypothetical protein
MMPCPRRALRTHQDRANRKCPGSATVQVSVVQLIPVRRKGLGQRSTCGGPPFIPDPVSRRALNLQLRQGDGSFSQQRASCRQMRPDEIPPAFLAMRWAGPERAVYLRQPCYTGAREGTCSNGVQKAGTNRNGGEVRRKEAQNTPAVTRASPVSVARSYPKRSHQCGGTT